MSYKRWLWPSCLKGNQMKLSQIGYAEIYKGEPVRQGQRNGVVGASRSDKNAPFHISWINGSDAIYAVDDPVLAEIEYCPDMNSGQRYVVAVHAKFPDIASRHSMLGCKIAEMGKNIPEVAESLQRSANLILDDNG